LPTYERLPRFDKDLERLSPEERERFAEAVARFVEDLRMGEFRAGLRVKGIQGAPGVFEMTWAPDGRATFEYGDEITPGEPHVIWRRVGRHAVFAEP
jgi:hypothetical protein